MPEAAIDNALKLSFSVLSRNLLKAVSRCLSDNHGHKSQQKSYPNIGIIPMAACRRSSYV
jgi:hypothetical protein